MGCSVIINGNARVFVDTATVRNSVRASGFSASALQNPDISRAQLAAMLRKKSRTMIPGKAGRNFWNAFLVNCADAPANANDGGQA